MRLTGDTPRPAGVFGSEGEAHQLAPSPAMFFTVLGRGFLVGELASKRTTPSERPAPALATWAHALGSRSPVR